MDARGGEDPGRLFSGPRVDRTLGDDLKDGLQIQVKMRERDSLAESPSARWRCLKGYREMTWSKWDPVLHCGEEVRGQEASQSSDQVLDDRTVEINVEICPG